MNLRRALLLCLALLLAAVSLPVLAQNAPNEADIRADLAEILSQPRFQRVEQPEQGFWERIWQQAIFNFLQWLTRVASNFPGGSVVFYGLLLLIVAGFATWAGLNLGRRRNRQVEARELFDRTVARRTDPTELEWQAEAAAGTGQFGEAIRFRFLAGLLRLDRAGAITYAPGLTNYEVAMAVGHELFYQLMDVFDNVVYGSGEATRADYELATTNWRRLLEEQVAVPA